MFLLTSINTISTLNTVMKLVSNIPAYIQIKEYYQHLIESGALLEGDYLPSVREVSLLIGVNPNTVQRAFSLLIEEGYLTPINGKGNRINKAPDGKENIALRNLIKEIQYQGYDLKEIKEQLDLLIKETEEKKL